MCDENPPQDEIFTPSHPERPTATGVEETQKIADPDMLGLGRSIGGAGQAMTDDPWRHRVMSMRCRTCMWYIQKMNRNLNEIGRCRRRAPTMNGYPVVFATDWCGDHKLDENK